MGLKSGLKSPNIKFLKAKKIVITGGPGSGKTTLINSLEQNGQKVLHEISREVIREAQKEGIEQLFLENPLLFSEKLLEGRLKQYEMGDAYSNSFLFFDRGMPDVTAYMDYMDIHYPGNFVKTCTENKYDAIFVLPPWKEIYIQDNERYESFGQAEKIFDFLKEGYRKYGYEVYEVPFATVNERMEYILNVLKS